MKKDDKEIEACPFCLSDGLDSFHSSSADLWIKGNAVGLLPRCNKCKKNIQPIVFKNKAEYEKAKKELGKK